MNKIDYSLAKKDKNLNFSLDSSRTVDSISELYNSDSIPLKTEIELEQNTNTQNIFPSNDDNSFNIKINQTENTKKENNLKENKKFFIFKLEISIALGIIYLILFLISMPRRPVKISEEKNLKLLINNNTSENINILLNNFKFYYGDKSEKDFNINSNDNKENDLDCQNKDDINNKKDKNDDYEFSGYLLEYQIDKTFIIRWLIGFLYFSVRCACFIYSHIDINIKFFNKYKVSSIQKVSCLLFPLWVFYYDIRNNTFAYTKIKTEIINGKNVSYFVMIEKNLSMIDYVEGIIPTSFYFLISIINKEMKKTIESYLGKKNKIKKIV